MKPTLTRVFRSHLDLHYGQRHLFRYVYRPQTAADESPKPYFHPLKTLAGNTVTLFRPYDHIWHHGLAMTMAVLSGQNFWGGPSYVKNQGYVRLPNNGRQVHKDWEILQREDETVALKEELHWLTLADEHWLSEERLIAVDEINTNAGYWSLKFQFGLHNVRSEPLIFGSPTTEGRPMAGYGSLVWRGPRSFLGGHILAGNDLEGPEVMGQAAPWLAFTGWHDGTYQQSTLLFIDQPDNPRYPNKWFVRHDPFPIVSYAFMFEEEYVLAPAETLTLTYRLVIINGSWSREKIELYLAGQAK